MSYAAIADMPRAQWSLAPPRGNGFADPGESAVTVRRDRRLTGWQDDLAALGSLYLFHDHEAVRRFLRTADEVRILLFDAFARITVVFGPYIQAVLDIQDDPDEDAEQMLLLTIRGGMEYGEARAKLDELDRSWWLAASADFGELIIDIE